jgi:hypothetical protein
MHSIVDEKYVQLYVCINDIMKYQLIFVFALNMIKLFNNSIKLFSIYMLIGNSLKLYMIAYYHM